MEGKALRGIGFAKPLAEEIRQSLDPLDDGVKRRAELRREPGMFDPGGNCSRTFGACSAP